MMTAHHAMGLTVILILTLMVLAGCTREVVRTVSAPLYLPDPPTLPAVKRERLECLGQEEYDALFVREELLREHRVQLKAVVCSTFQEGKECPKWEEWE